MLVLLTLLKHICCMCIHSINLRQKHSTLSMLKIVEFVLLKINMQANVSYCNNSVFDECIRIASEKYSKAHAFAIGKELEKLSSFLSDNMMTNSSYLFWVNPIRYRITQSWTGYDSSLEGHPRLPDIKSVIAIAEIFQSGMNNYLQEIYSLHLCLLYLCAHQVGYQKF